MERSSDRTIPHGHRLPAHDRRLLRGRPPDAALDWAAGVFGPSAHVRSVRALAGGTSSAIHALVIEDARRRVHRVVLRRFVRAEWLAREPDLAAREGRTLRFLEAHALPTPRLLAVDPDGTLAGVPAVLMTRLPGKITWNPADARLFLDRLAELLPLIHAIPVPPTSSIPRYEPYALEIHRPPRWASRPDVWLRAIEVHEAPAPASERAFIHRDFHPGNVLWSRGRISGIIDWVNAGVGSPDADVGHCRVNLARHFDQATADQFLDIYQSLAGRTGYHPYWDIVAAIGGMDSTWDDRPDPAVERFLAEAVERA